MLAAAAAAPLILGIGAEAGPTTPASPPDAGRWQLEALGSSAPIGSFLVSAERDRLGHLRFTFGYAGEAGSGCTGRLPVRGHPWIRSAGHGSNRSYYVGTRMSRHSRPALTPQPIAIGPSNRSRSARLKMRFTGTAGGAGRLYVPRSAGLPRCFVRFTMARLDAPGLPGPSSPPQTGPSPAGPLSDAPNGANWVAPSGDQYVAQTPDRPWNLAVGTGYVRMELRPGDQWLGDSSHGKHVERVQLVGPREPLDVDVWTSFAFRLNGLSDTSQMTLIYELKQAPEPNRGESGKVPSVALKFQRGSLQLVTAGDPSAVTTTDSYRAYQNIQTILPWRGVHATDGSEWVNVVIRSRMHWEHGEVQMWINGTQVSDASHICNAYNDASPAAQPTSVLAIYRGAQKATQVLEFANIEVGTEPLIDRVTAPLPVPGVEPARSAPER